jgi:hypothetical protein
MKILATTKARNAKGAPLRVCTMEAANYRVDTIESNLFVLARLQAESRRRGHARSTAWLGERMAFWAQFLRPQFAAEVIAKALA